jgi:hypothetical protein
VNPFTEFGEKCDVLAPPPIQVVKPYLAGGLVDAFQAQRRDQTRIRELTVRHGLKMMIGARLTWDDGSCEATTIPVERTPIRWAEYARCVGCGGGCGLARRIRR